MHKILNYNFIIKTLIILLQKQEVGISDSSYDEIIADTPTISVSQPTEVIETKVKVSKKSSYKKTNPYNGEPTQSSTNSRRKRKVVIPLKKQKNKNTAEVVDTPEDKQQDSTLIPKEESKLSEIAEDSDTNDKDTPSKRFQVNNGLSVLTNLKFTKSHSTVTRLEDDDQELAGYDLIDEHSFVAHPKLPLGSPQMYKHCSSFKPGRLRSLRSPNSQSEAKSILATDEFNESEIFMLSEVSPKLSVVNKEGRASNKFNA